MYIYIYTFIICREEPDAVFLQEVVPIGFDLIQNLLPEYNSYTGLLIIFLNKI